MGISRLWGSGNVGGGIVVTAGDGSGMGGMGADCGKLVEGSC